MPDQPSDFIPRWEASAAAERANYQLFLSELCDFLGISRPDPTVADDEHNNYVFERRVQFRNVDGSTSTGRIDLYKKGSFVLEAKQGSNQTTASEPLIGSLRVSTRGCTTNLSPKPKQTN